MTIYVGSPAQRTVSRFAIDGKGCQKYIAKFSKMTIIHGKQKNSYGEEPLFTFPLGDCTEDDYYNLPDDCMVEVINGVIYNMASPNIRHYEVSEFLEEAIRRYLRQKKGDCRMFHALE